MASYRANFGDLLEPGLRKIFDDRYDEIPAVFSSIFHVLNSSTDVERDSAITGFSLLEQTAEGGAIQYEDPVQKRAACNSNIARKFLNLRETLLKSLETIRSQIRRLVSLLRGSETIIGIPLWGNGIVRTAW